MDKTCIICQKQFHAKRATAKFCSATCRKAYSRDIKEGAAPIKKPIQSVHPKDRYIMKKNYTKQLVAFCVKCEYELDLDDEWSHAFCWKTAEEREAHYTLKNFPLRYYGGGNTWRRSPYPKTEKRSLAYTD